MFSRLDAIADLMVEVVNGGGGWEERGESGTWTVLLAQLYSLRYLPALATFLGGKERISLLCVYAIGIVSG